MPTHWDRFNVPYGVSQQPAIERLQSFIAEVKAASPRTDVIVPKYFDPITVESSRQLGKYALGPPLKEAPRKGQSPNKRAGLKEQKLARTIETIFEKFHPTGQPTGWIN